jgi:hypothetical protein
MPTLAYSTSTDKLRRGWDALDQRVLRTFDTATGTRSFADVVAALPDGMHFTVVRGSLAVLVHLRLLSQRDDTGPWELTDAGRDRLADLTSTRKAA